MGPFFPFAATKSTRRLDDLAKRDKYDLGQHILATIQQLTWQGRLHGMPWLTHAGWSGLLLNEDVWQRAGQAPPTWDWTYDTEFRAAATHGFSPYRQEPAKSQQGAFRPPGLPVMPPRSLMRAAA